MGPSPSNLAWYERQLWAGMSLLPWLSLLYRNRLDVSPRRWPRTVITTLFTALTSILGLAQRSIYGRRIARTPLPDDPLFIIGHWRSGTTLLHELLALDERNRCPTTYECLQPHHFLLSERLVRKFLWFMLPARRPMDDMRLGFDHPQEDEIALCHLGSRSPFLTVAFPKRPPQDPDYIDLGSLPPDKLARWQAIMCHFYRSVLFRRGGRLVLKSPQHAYRLTRLVEIFPRARFVHMVRDPYAVFPSTVHLWMTLYREFSLQSPPYPGVEEKVYGDFVRMHDALAAARGAIPDDRFAQMRYEDLVADPAGQLQALYRRLELGDFEAVRPAVDRYTRAARNYRTNRYELSRKRYAEITERWGPYIERSGYTIRTMSDMRQTTGGIQSRPWG